jgi:hypothetical protein
MKESNRVDADYKCSWYRRYRQSVELGEDGTEVVTQKPVVTHKDNLVNLTTSFNHSSGDGVEVWGDTSEECGNEGGGIFSSLFS